MFDAIAEVLSYRLTASAINELFTGGNLWVFQQRIQQLQSKYSNFPKLLRGLQTIR